MIFFCLISSTILCQSDLITFDKSQKEYKIKDYLYGNKPEQVKNNDIINHYIKFDKKPIISNNIKTYSLYFNNKKHPYYINFSNDTIYIGNTIEKPIFILNENAIGDTIFINSFLHNHFTCLVKKYYYSAINDDVYVFKLWYDRNPYKKETFLYSSSEDDLTYNYIAISKKYGFVWINYNYHRIEVELRYH
jgi:hypothetical protein